MFRRVACVYDIQAPLERRALSMAAQALGPVVGKRVLDVGTGTGLLAAALCRSGQPLQLTVTDRSPHMLARAKRRLPNAATLVASGDRLPFADHSFDVVGIGFLLHLLTVEARHAVLQEARRVLAADGRLVVVHHVSASSGVGRAIWQRVARTFPPGADVRPAFAAAGLTTLASTLVPGLYRSQVIVAAPSAARP